ncbi:unnamed protein product [Amaranthus hypochondriacus]
MRVLRKLKLAQQAFVAVKNNSSSNRCVCFRSLFTSSSALSSGFHASDSCLTSNFVSSKNSPLINFSYKPWASFLVVEAVAVMVVGCEGSKEEDDDVDSNGFVFFLNSMKSP